MNASATLLLACALTLPLASSGEAAGSHPEPMLAFAIVTGGSVVVTWTPVVEAEYYVVYGVEDGTLVPLSTTQSTTLRVKAGYEEYAVAAVSAGHEGQAIVAQSIPCPRVERVGPPPEVAIEKCLG